MTVALLLLIHFCMETSAKIIFLNRKNLNVGNKNIESHGLRDTTWDDISTVLTNAQHQIKKIEEEWEIDHNKVTLRDEIHLMRFYLNLLIAHLKDNKTTD
ncbi:MAG: hypothetical protein N3D15_06305 [Syntrophorhabdaceae bacterium]|nr:hypothetical protein [Syntrophorhabdaceae bacterium]